MIHAVCWRKTSLETRPWARCQSRTKSDSVMNQKKCSHRAQVVFVGICHRDASRSCLMFGRNVCHLISQTPKKEASVPTPSRRNCTGYSRPRWMAYDTPVSHPRKKMRILSATTKSTTTTTIITIIILPILKETPGTTGLVQSCSRYVLMYIFSFHIYVQ